MNIDIKTVNDNAHWDSFILKNNPWSLFQSFEWGEVEKLGGHQVIRLELIVENVREALMQVFVIRAKRGTFLHIRHGPVFLAGKWLNKQHWEIILHKLLSIAQAEKAWFIRFSPMVEDSPQLAQLLEGFGCNTAPIHAMDAELCWVLDISKSPEELLSEMRKSTRYLIRQGEKMGIKITQSANIGNFLKLYEQTARRQGFVVHSAIAQEYEVFHSKKRIVVFEAHHEGVLLSSAVILFFGDQAIYHHGASIPTKIPASSLLQWYAIKEAKTRGMKFYNFWGIAPPDKKNHPWRGLTLFKQGFGGYEKRFLHARDLPLSPFYRISYTIEWLRKLQKGY